MLTMLNVHAYLPSGKRPAIMQVIIQGQRSDGSYADLLFNGDHRGGDWGIVLPPRAAGRRALVVVRDSGSRSGPTLIARYVTLPLGGSMTLSNAPRWRPAASVTARMPLRLGVPRGTTMLRGFGQAEEVVEETVTTAAPVASDGVKTAVAVGGLALIGLGLFYGLTEKTASGQRVFRGAV